ncbi:MAG: ABC transporter permease subunit [Nitrospinae bacterium]|nr:ABC transporter permease subunit [Nitrospinota bacterium]
MDKMGGPRPAGNLRPRLKTDVMTRRLVTLGGGAVIASILCILLVIVAEVYPLFTPARATMETALTPAEGERTPISMGLDEYRQSAYLITKREALVVSMKDGILVKNVRFPWADGAVAVSATPLADGVVALGLSDGRVAPVEITFESSFNERGEKVADCVIRPGEPVVVNKSGGAVKFLAHAQTEQGPVTAAVIGPDELAVLSVTESKSLVGPVEKQATLKTVPLPLEGVITAIAMDKRGEDIFIGTSAGRIARVSLKDSPEPVAGEIVTAASAPGASVSVLGFLLGGRTLVAGDTAGAVSSWQMVNDEHGVRRLIKNYSFTSHRRAVTSFASSARNKGFVTADESGQVMLRYGTTGSTLLRVEAAGEKIGQIVMPPKGDAFAALTAAGEIKEWKLDNPHPEVTLRGLFGKVRYEGYEQGEYVWQSTGGADDFEAKLSLTPLIFGTLKGTFYALLFAVPLSLLAALYTSQFMGPGLKGIVKPAVEIMAAMPSVVLGFIAGLWLAPVMEKIAPGVFLMPFMAVASVLAAFAVWSKMASPELRGRMTHGKELLVIIPAVLAAVWLSLSLGALLEQALLGGDYRVWLREALGLTFDQRNSLVVGFAMGFAVIPIIFTIAEDSLSNVPAHLKAGSLALGATPWQTALRVALPAASPGIFSAIMIGFGRAVGETMIVLMATGNTSIMDLSVFNGFRALSANIAVELPEAPEQGTLYRTLFLAALLLFAMTFIVNTAAEMVRLKLRKRYSEI